MTFIDKAVAFAIEGRVNLVSVCKELLENRKITRLQKLNYACFESDQLIAELTPSFPFINCLTHFLFHVANHQIERQQSKDDQQQTARQKPNPFLTAMLYKPKEVYYVLGTYGNVLGPEESRLRRKWAH